MTSFLANLTETIGEVVRAHWHLAEPIAFALGFAEGLPGLSILVPGSAILIGLGTMYANTGGAFFDLWLAAALGAFIGDLCTYGIGRYFKHDIARIWPFSKHADWLPRGHALFERWGLVAIVLGKFIGLLRPMIAATAGVVGMSPARFAPASLLASAIWAGVLLSPGFGLHQLSKVAW